MYVPLTTSCSFGVKEHSTGKNVCLPCVLCPHVGEHSEGMFLSFCLLCLPGPRWQWVTRAGQPWTVWADDPPVSWRGLATGDDMWQWLSRLSRLSRQCGQSPLQYLQGQLEINVTAPVSPILTVSTVSPGWRRCRITLGSLFWLTAVSTPPLLRQTLLVVLRQSRCDGRPGDCRSRGSELCCYCDSCCSCSCCFCSYCSCCYSCSCSCSYSFSCSYSCSSCFSCCSMPVKGDGLVLLTGWLPDYCPGFPQSSSIPVSWATSGVEVTNSWWAWWVLCILFTATPSSTGCCLRLAALQPRPLWRALHSAPRSGRRGVKSWRCRTSVCSPQTDCVVRKEVTEFLAWRGNAPSF